MVTLVEKANQYKRNILTRNPKATWKKLKDEQRKGRKRAKNGGKKNKPRQNEEKINPDQWSNFDG